MKGFPLKGLLFGFWVTTVNKVFSCYDPWGESFGRGLHFCGTLCRVGWQLVTDISGQCIGPICKGQASWIVLLLKMGQICCPGLLVTNCQTTPHNIPEACEDFSCTMAEA
jgi:hypothetical protein